MIFCVVGPTCSGKSSLALKIAKKFNAIIVNCDAYQIYKELNIGTAKPKEEEFEGIKHYLFNTLSVSDSFSIYSYQKMFREIVDEHLKNNENIVVVGGSGLYLRSAIYDYELPENESVDETYLSYLETLSNENLYELLIKQDEESSKKIHPNNRKRVIRALLVIHDNGKSKSEIESNQEKKMLYDCIFIGLNPDRELLYDNINKRVEEMFSLGLENEVKYLTSTFDKNLYSLQAIGYKEFFLGLSLEETKELIKKNTRNYAKRQLTFFKHQFENVNWFNDANEAYEYIEKTY